MRNLAVLVVVACWLRVAVRVVVVVVEIIPVPPPWLFSMSQSMMVFAAAVVVVAAVVAMKIGMPLSLVPTYSPLSLDFWMLWTWSFDCPPHHDSILRSIGRLDRVPFQ